MTEDGGRIVLVLLIVLVLGWERLLVGLKQRERERVREGERGFGRWEWTEVEILKTENRVTERNVS